jgi:hypothetical protein
VDADGMLYMTGYDQSEKVLFKYNPTTESVEQSYGDGNLASAWDIIIKDDYIYVANDDGPDGYQIIRMNKDFTSVEGYGDNTADPESPNAGEFLGPHRFVAILNKKITVTDELDNSDYDDVERLVSFEDMDGTGWDTFDPSEIGESAFSFFENY